MRFLLLFLSACATKEPADSAVEESDADVDVDIWDDCPRADSAVGDPNWAGRLEVTDGALYCAGGDETWTLEEVLANKGRARAIPGVYPFPTTAGSFPLTIPACTEDPAGVVDATTGTGTASVAAAGSYVQVSVFQPSTAGVGIGVVLLHDLSTGDAMTANGQGPKTGFDASSAFLLLSTTAGGEMSRSYGPCASAETWRVDQHHVTFDGGYVDLTLHIGDSAAGTEPWAFVDARGQLDGVDFVQTDYYRLVYRPDHHHFGRHFAVILPTPIGEACALRVENLSPSDPTQGTVSLADCSLTVLSTRALAADDLTQTGPP